ncbi:MAG: hypothetical protein Kow0073_04060 [Immundisolibacter sp.]
MKELADRPLRVPAEPWPLHAWRLLCWLLELRLVPRPTERRGGWRAPLRTLRDGLTATGRVLLLASFALLLLTRPSQPGFDLALAAAGLSVVLLSALVGWWWRPRLQVTRLERPVAVAGVPCRGRVRVVNVGRRAARDLMLREWRGGGWRLLPAAHRALIGRLNVGESTVYEVAFVPRERGILHLPGLAAHSYFPLFLTCSTQRLPQPLEVVVRPAPLVVSLPPLRELAARCLAAGAQAAPRQGTFEYAYSRPYQPGDLPSRLDHRASARRGELMARVFHGGVPLQARGAVLCCDTSVAGFEPWQRRPRDGRALDRRLALLLELAAQARAAQLPPQALALGEDWQMLADEAALERAVAKCAPARVCRLPDAPLQADWLHLVVTEDASPQLLAPVAAWRAAGRLVLVFRLGGAGRALPEGPGNHEVHA